MDSFLSPLLLSAELTKKYLPLSTRQVSGSAPGYTSIFTNGRCKIKRKKKPRRPRPQQKDGDIALGIAHGERVQKSVQLSTKAGVVQDTVQYFLSKGYDVTGFMHFAITLHLFFVLCLSLYFVSSTLPPSLIW